MARQLLSPVCADAILRFQGNHRTGDGWWRSPHRFFGTPNGRCGKRSGSDGSISRRGDLPVLFASSADSGKAISQDDVADDYYSVLGLMPDATPQQIKKAYYDCMKACHPDLTGNDPATNNFCMFINEVYAVLSDPVQRMVYDEIHGYAATATNPFLDVTSPRDHTFVDEFSCIGCKNCAGIAPDVFSIEEDFGRARVYCQNGNPELVQDAIDSCPVDCIHWTSAAQLSLLEDEMRRVERVNVGVMLAGMGASADVFRMASTRWQKRQSKVLERARREMMKNEESGATGSNWNDVWGRRKDFGATEEDVKKRAKRAAAAARRWREYSKAGADKPPTTKLPEATSISDN